MYGSVRTDGAFDLVVMAASQGGLAVYRQLLAALPREFPAGVVVLLHRPAGQPDQLPGLPARHTSLRVRPATASEQPQGGTVYVAPADRQRWSTPTVASDRPSCRPGWRWPIRCCARPRPPTGPA